MGIKSNARINKIGVEERGGEQYFCMKRYVCFALLGARLNSANSALCGLAQNACDPSYYRSAGILSSMLVLHSLACICS